MKVFVRVGVSAAPLYFVLRSIDLGAFWERVWRWERLLRAQHVGVAKRKLTESIWVRYGAAAILVIASRIS